MKCNLIPILLIILYCIALNAQTVQYNQEFQVNTYTEFNQYFPSVSGLSDSGFVICWGSYPQDGDEGEVFGQIYNSTGTKRGGEFQINTYEAHDQYFPKVSGISDSGFVVCWESLHQDGDASGVFAQMYDNNGIKRGEEFQVNTDITFFQMFPYVCGLFDGGFVICWENENYDGSVISGQIYNNNGTKRGIEFQVNSSAIMAHTPTICSFADGGFVVCWESQFQDGDESGIFGQKYDNGGTKIGEEFQVNTFTPSSQVYPSISTLSDGGFVVCWGSDIQDSSDFGVYAQIYDKDGNKSGVEIPVNTYTNRNQWMSNMSGLSDGGFIICWQSDLQDGSDHGVYGQLYDNNGNKRGKEFRVNSYINNDQELPSVCGLSNGNFVVCWDSWDQDGSGYGIFGKYFLGTPIIHLLQSFSLISPAYDTTIYSTTVNFQWQKTSPIHVNFPWELEYTHYLAKTEDFNDSQIFSDIYDTTFTVKQLTPGQTYFWKVLAKNIAGDSLWSSETFGFFVSPDATQITHDPVINVQEFELFSNYPNPFNPETTIRYSLPADQSSYRVIIKIYDVLGQLVSTLKDEQQRPGLYHLTWDGRNPAGQSVPSGVYFCVLQAGNFKATQKMLLVR